MTDATDYSTPAQVRRIAEDFRRRRTRMLVAFACVEAPVLVGAIVVVYVLKLVDPQFGMWLVVGVAVISGMALSALILGQIRAEQRAIREVGGTPLPSSSGPTL